MKKIFIVITVFTLCACFALNIFAGSETKPIQLNKDLIQKSLAPSSELKNVILQKKIDIIPVPTLKVDLPRVNCTVIATTPKMGFLNMGGTITNLSPFRVELHGYYKGTDPVYYNDFAVWTGTRTVIKQKKIYLNPGEKKDGALIFIALQTTNNVPATMISQDGQGVFRLKVYPVNDKNERIGKEKYFFYPVPRPDGFIPVPPPSGSTDMYDRYQCLCESTECSGQTQG